MVYKLTKNEEGSVRDSQGVRYHLAECRVVYTPSGMNVGYTEFPTRAAALAFYGVSEIPEEELYPEPEEI